MFLRKDLTGHMDYVSENYSKHLLSDGYFSCSVGNVSKETIEKYTQDQG